MIEIDGSQGEGGGQILRTSLALSIITGKPMRMFKIRAGRSRPGLQRQHLTAVQAAVAVCGAQVTGDAIGSLELSFTPSQVRAGDYHFAVGTAGSCLLVLQTVLPALMLADGPSRVVLEGGTHNPFAPPFDFLKHCYAPLLRKMGPSLELTLQRGGFYPAGGGRCAAEITPSPNGLRPLELTERGKLVDQQMVSILSRLPQDVGNRELDTAGRLLGWPKKSRTIHQVDSPGAGNALLLSVEFENVTEMISGFGDKKTAAEFVAKRAARQMKEYLAADAPVGIYLADQLLLPIALAGNGRFRCLRLTEHTITNIQTIQYFLDREIISRPQSDGSVMVEINTP